MHAGLACGYALLHLKVASLRSPDDINEFAMQPCSNSLPFQNTDMPIRQLLHDKPY